MSDPYGGPFPEWDPAATYAAEQRVTYQGYIYISMTATSAGDNPRTATYTATATNAIAPGSETRTMRKWTIWDYPVGHYMAKLRGLPVFEVLGPEEVRTFCVRGMYTDTPLDYVYPSSASYTFYDMPAGMDTVWPEPDYGELMAAPSAVPLEDSTRPKAYLDPLSISSEKSLCFQPNTVSAIIMSDLNGGFPENYLLPAWSAETQGQMFACAGTFSRVYGFRILGTGTDESATPAFQDNWEATRAWVGYDGLDYIIYTEPDLRTDY